MDNAECLDLVERVSVLFDQAALNPFPPSPCNLPRVICLWLLLTLQKLGILDLLNEESKFPKGTDKSLLEKLHSNHKVGCPFGLQHLFPQLPHPMHRALPSAQIPYLLSSLLPSLALIFLLHTFCAVSSYVSIATCPCYMFSVVLLLVVIVLSQVPRPYLCGYNAWPKSNILAPVPRPHLTR